MVDIVSQCVEDMVARVKKVVEDNLDLKIKPEKVLNVYSEKDLFEKSSLFKPPFLGIMYEGLRTFSRRVDFTDVGIANICHVAVILGTQSQAIGNVDTRIPAHIVLGFLRRAVVGQVSPSGHKWSFQSEMYMGVMNETIVYLQRWVVNLMVTR